MRSLTQIVAIGLLLGGAAFARAQNKLTCTVDHTPPGDAEKAMLRRDYAQAGQIYAAALKENPAPAPATIGLIRVELAEGKLDDALALARKQVSDHPRDARFQGVLGEVALRRGEPEQAVAAFRNALDINPCIARLHFDISRYLNLSGMAATARRQLEVAHSLAPEDPFIARAWTAATTPPLSPEQRIARLKDRMDAPGATDEAKAAAAEAIKGIEARQRGDCEPVNPVETATLKMVPIANGPTRPLYAVGLDVSINGKHKRLEIDTGASGLLISRSSAVSAGLIPEAEIKTGGIGDRGPSGAFVTHVDDLRIGNMEFRNCMVRVLEKRSALEVDGLIGADVFRNYLVTLDTPSREVRLAPLPKRPDDSGKPGGLATTGDTAEAEAAPPAAAKPQDRYIAPEMQDWTRIYRIGHQLIVPTEIGKAPTKLFILDTGASTGLISPEAAREVTHVDANDRLHVHGISGSVKDVSQAEQVTIQFAHVRQSLPGMISIDTSAVSHSLGLEIAGFIGFQTLSELVISIDYRDNLIHVDYDPKHGYHAH